MADRVMLFSMVTAEEQIYSGEATFVSCEGAEGELGIKAGHAALLTSIPPGAVEVIKPDGEREVFYVAGGYLEVQPDEMFLLADTAERASGLDEEAALQAQAEAEEALKDLPAEAMDHARLLAQAAAAAAQLRALRMMTKRS